MDRPDVEPRGEIVRDAPLEDPTFCDRHGYLRPGRYFHFYLLYEPTAGKTCWLPDGYHT